MTKAKPKMEFTTREGYLLAATHELRQTFLDAGYELPDRIQISVGFPGTGKSSTRVGECWKRSDDGPNHVFIHPSLETAMEALDVLVHELCHAVDNCENKHGAPFRNIGQLVGLVGKAKEMHAGEELLATLRRISAGLGAYPHVKLDPVARPTKPQTNRQLLISCTGIQCDFKTRMSQKWIDKLPENPECWICGSFMERQES